MSIHEKLAITEASSNVALDAGQVAAAAEIYETHRNEEDGPVLVGLYGEDLRAAMNDLGTVMVKYTIEGQDNAVYNPLLVPTDRMEWYNLPYLHDRFGEDTPLYCYVHPPIPQDELSREVVANAVQSVLDDGAVVLFEQYRGYPVLDSEQWDVEEAGDKPSSRNLAVTRGESEYQLEGMNDGRVEKRSDLFVGEIIFDGVDTIKEAPPAYEVYEKAVERGEIIADRENGSILEQAMTEEDAQRVWDIYEKPFERLSKGNPVLAGFDEESLKALQADPEVIKVVNRDQDEITTVGVFSQDFEHCPWFNPEYFKRNYSEYYESKNILMCPSIVSDEERRGHTYSWALVQKMVEALAQRGTNLLLAFECTEISTRYIPEKVVKRGVAASGLAKAIGFEKPVGVMEYKALRKKAED